jgi:hypothetical protein
VAATLAKKVARRSCRGSSPKDKSNLEKFSKAAEIQGWLASDHLRLAIYSHVPNGSSCSWVTSNCLPTPKTVTSRFSWAPIGVMTQKCGNGPARELLMTFRASGIRVACDVSKRSKPGGSVAISDRVHQAISGPYSPSSDDESSGNSAKTNLYFAGKICSACGRVGVHPRGLMAKCRV